MKISLAGAVLSLLILVLPAAAEDKDAAEAAATPETLLGMMTMKPGAEMSEADRGYMKSMQTMQQSMMKTEMSGDPSGDFVRVMIPHHQSAIDMVDVLLSQKDVDPTIARLAEKMKRDQAKEIADMQEWLDTHQK